MRYYGEKSRLACHKNGTNVYEAWFPLGKVMEGLTTFGKLVFVF
jgi:Zn-dependent oligopeptidase